MGLETDKAPEAKLDIIVRKSFQLLTKVLSIF